MKLAVILVHYHAAALAVEAYESFAADLRASRLGAEWIVVDNGSSPEEREKLATLPIRVLDPGENLGYAGGANLGARETESDFVVLMNPDVWVLPGCIRALLDALEAGADVAGPRFFWDRQRRFLLPPTEKRTRRDELLRALGERGEPWSGMARRRWRRHARRNFEAREPYRCFELSGALLAFRRGAFADLGGFDDGYRLYFEETDWLERLRSRGLEARFVPRAEAVHLYAQSTVGEPRAQSWFDASHRRFRRRFYGSMTAALVERIGASRKPAERVRAPLRPSPAEAPVWLEVSSSPQGYPAAARLLEDPSPEDGSHPLPAEIRERLPPGTYYLRTVHRSGRELGLDLFQKRSPSPLV